MCTTEKRLHEIIELAGKAKMAIGRLDRAITESGEKLPNICAAIWLKEMQHLIGYIHGMVDTRYNKNSS